MKIKGEKTILGNDIKTPEQFIVDYKIFCYQKISFVITGFFIVIKKINY